jgi:hypothetical protein
VTGEIAGGAASQPSARADDRPDPVARVFQGLLGVMFVVAWASLGAQLDVLVGSRGLFPAKDLAKAVASRPDLSFFDVPTVFRWDASDATLHAGIWVGVALGVAVVLGILPRVALAASTFLYLGYAVVARSFLSFQWDNLLLECGALGALLPVHRSSRWVNFLLKVLLFKLYFESGIAKYESHLGDWKDGSAMRYYYETAPLPTWLGWYAHHSPPWFHAIESRATLAFEILVPFAIFGPQKARLTAFFVFTGFQLVNIATANYGFFSYLALVLGVLLLDERDVSRLKGALARLVRRLPMPASVASVAARARALHEDAVRARAQLKALWRPRLGINDTLSFLVRLSTASVVSVTYLWVSLHDALANFVPDGADVLPGEDLAQAIAPLRIVNTYHLFGQITRERIEPTFETFDGARWTEQDLRYKPGDPRRPPPFVAPHQPRVDFLLWFYGLGVERGPPAYVAALVERLCHDPSAVQSLFPDPLPRSPLAARVAFYRYHFTTPAERRNTGAYWKREEVYEPRVLECRAQPTASLTASSTRS